jgi:hypothetical protein
MVKQLERFPANKIVLYGIRYQSTIYSLHRASSAQLV